jgi:hypothetical protein
MKTYFQITDTRFIWTIEKLLDFITADRFKTQSLDRLLNIAFSHGARDCETYRTEVAGEPNEALKGNSTYVDYDRVRKFLRIDGDGLKTLDITKIEEHEKILETAVGTAPQRHILTIKVADSIFMPKLLNPYNPEDSLYAEKKDENNKIHLTGFTYTKIYIRGFFHGLLRHLNREPVTGFYHHSVKGFYCFYKGRVDNNYQFDICTDSNDIDERSLEFNAVFDNSPLIYTKE